MAALKLGTLIFTIGLLCLLLSALSLRFASHVCAAGLLWPAVVFMVVGLSHVACPQLGLRVLGKRVTGGLSPGALLVFLPFYLLVWGVWLVRISILRRKEAGCTRVWRNVYVGSYPLGLPQDGLPSDLQLVVDLTAEFPGQHLGAAKYVLAQAFDTDTPDPEAWIHAAQCIANQADSRHFRTGSSGR
ncbi:hypothetical protein DIPPA_06945 [Diplonema papillatum]|nr:hypothetical protein DIPPA_06945 [Diplonema papillatum]